jgi:GT2 family glycosyltransferase
MSGQRANLVAIVVTYNRLAQIKVTLAALLAEPCDYVVVFDNGSTDGTRAWLAGLNDARLHLILSKENLGGAGGFEAGMRAAVSAYDPAWLVVMDDDARPMPGAFARFLALDKQGRDAVAAAVYYPDGRICEMNRPSVNPFWHLRAFLRTFLGGGRRGFHISDAAYEGNGQAVDVASFVGLFVSREAIMRAGYPDGRLFLYGDDAIYTLGLSKRGFSIHFAPDIRFQHDCSTFETEIRVYRPLWKVYFNYRNGLILYHETAGIWFWPVLLVVVPKWLWNGRHYGTDKRQYYRLLWRAVRDGIRGRLGAENPYD